jgi:hypothetical protein
LFVTSTSGQVEEEEEEQLGPAPQKLPPIQEETQLGSSSLSREISRSRIFFILCERILFMVQA